MRDAKDIFGKISQTNHYVVSFSALNNAVVNHIRRKFGVSDARDFVSRKSDFYVLKQFFLRVDMQLHK